MKDLTSILEQMLVELVIDHFSTRGFNYVDIANVHWSTENPDDIHVDMSWGTAITFTDERDVVWKRQDGFKGIIHTGVPADMLADMAAEYVDRE